MTYDKASFSLLIVLLAENDFNRPLLFFAAMQQAVISFNRTTFFQSFAHTRLRMRATECTEKAKPRGSLLSSPSSLLQTIWMCTTTRLPCSSTRTMWWTSVSSTAVLTPTGYPTSWMSSPGPCLLSGRKVNNTTQPVCLGCCLTTN